MELHILCSVLTFCIFLAIFITLNPSNFKKLTKNLPPGPWKLPLIGNIHQFVSPLPHQTLRNLASQYGPLMHLQLGEKLHIIVSSAEMAKEIMKTHDVIFANRPHLLASKFFAFDNTDVVYSSYGNYWRQLKKLCISKLFAPKRIQSFRFVREEEVSKLVRNIYANEGSVVNLSAQIVFMANDIIARAVFGRRYRDQMAFLSALGDMSKLLAGFSIVDFYPSIKVLPLLTGMKGKLERLQKENNKVLENIVKDYKENKSSQSELEEDLFDALLKTEKMDDDLKIPITHNNIKAVIWVSMQLTIYNSPCIVQSIYKL